MKTIKDWIKLSALPKPYYFILITLLGLEGLIFIFNPISFAYIASFVLEQNYKLSSLWAVIFFSLQILSCLLTHIKTNELIKLKLFIKTKLLFKRKPALKKEQKIFVSNFLDDLCNFILGIIKIVLILLTALIYSLPFFVFILAGFLFISMIVFCFNKFFLRRKNYSLNSLSTTSCLLNTIWTILISALSLYSIHLASTRILSLTIFLLINNFISNHLTKMSFNLNIIKNYNNIKSIFKEDK